MSLSSFFEKRGKKEQPEQVMSSLFSEKQSKKFKELKEEEKPTVVYLPPEPKKDEPENLDAAIFVGNVPLSFKQKDLRNMFSQYGTIEKIWFRSVPVEQNKLGKKASFILKKYAEGADSMNAYVRFAEKASAEQACRLNGAKV